MTDPGPTPLRRVDPTRAPGRFARAYAALAATLLARFISRHIGWKLDPRLLRATRGRVSSTLVFPTAVLETRGAKSNVTRQNAVIYFHDAEQVIIAASNAGAGRHPAWIHNLLANLEITFGGIPMTASVFEGATERARLWTLADRVFPTFATYRCEATTMGREIPLIALKSR